MATAKQIDDYKADFIESRTRELRDRIAELARTESDPERLAAKIVELPEVSGSIASAANSNAMFAMRGQR